MVRKYPLKKNEIEMLQIILEDKAFPTESYRMELANRLEDLKASWYKVNKKEQFAIEVIHDE